MKINVDSVGFKNFLSFGSKWQDVQLKHGLNFVTGWDASRNKSNGAGKSSFLESIIFALYGKTARNIKKEQIVNWKNKKQCEVVFRFDINDSKYEILRAIKPDKFEIYKNGTMLDQDAHVKDYQSMFEEDIFGLDLKMFTSLVHSNTNSSTTNILSMKKPEKRKLMEKMFDLVIFSKMNEICNEKLRNIQGKTRETELKVESHLNQIEEAMKMIEKFQDEIKKKAVIEKELDEMLLAFKELVDDHPNIEEVIEDLSKKIEEKENALSKQIQLIDTKVTEIKVKIENLENELEEVQKLDRLIEKNDEYQNRIDKIEKEVGTVEQISNRMELIGGHKKDNEESRKKYVDEYNKIEKEMIEYNADLKNLEKNLELLKEGICPVCRTKVEDPKAHYGKEISGTKRKITTRIKKLKPFVQDIEMLDIAIKGIDKESNSLQSSKDEILTLNSKIIKVTKRDRSELKDEILKHSDNIEKLYRIRLDLNNKGAEEVSPLHNKWKDLNEEFSKIKRKEREVEELKTKVGVEQENIKSFEQMIKDQEVKIDEINRHTKELSESMNKFQTLKDYLNAIKGLLKDEKIKQHMISKIMPYLNQQANYYLSEVDYSFYVKIDKWLDIVIKGPGISNATYDSLSGGERRGIDLAIQLGFLDIARTQSGIFPDLLIFDELLDSSIDAQGIGEVLKIVRVKQREANGKFFIISHRSEIDNDLIDNIYHVIKESGYSRIEI